MVTCALPLRVVEVREYLDARGRSRYGDWLAKLDFSARARIIASVLRLKGGNFTLAKPLGSGLSELRLDFGPGYRIYFGKDGERFVILLGGGTKRRQQADISAAHTLWSDYKRRKREE